MSHFSEMFDRTGADVGSDETTFDAAGIFIFCSAVVSREMMEVDPMNVTHCPYGIFVTDRNGEVPVGYRTYPDGTMRKVQTLLDEIATEAVGR